MNNGTQEVSKNNVLLNPALIAKQGLTEEEVENIITLHKQLDHVLNNPEEYDDPVQTVEEFEYALQRAWKFEEDRKFHTHWLRIKGCTCPVLDNRDRFYTGYRVHSITCKWHGD